MKTGNFFSVFSRKRKNAIEIFELRGQFAEGLKLYLSTKNLERWAGLISGNYDTELFEKVSQERNNTNVVWDIGAHFGYSSLVFANILKNANIYSFEPNVFNLERFRQNLSLNPQLKEKIHIIPLAVSNIEGQETFSLSNNVDGSQSSGSHLVKASKPLHQSIYDKFHFSDTLVEVSSMDILIKLYPKPDLIKIDVEGAELFVLKGGIQLLTKFAPTLLMEIHNISIMHEMVNLLRDLNYQSKIIETKETSLSRCFIIAKRKK